MFLVPALPEKEPSAMSKRLHYKRLFWMGYPLELHSWLTPELEELIELSRRYDPGTLPKTVVLERNHIATPAC